MPFVKFRIIYSPNYMGDIPRLSDCGNWHMITGFLLGGRHLMNQGLRTVTNLPHLDVARLRQCGENESQT